MTGAEPQQGGRTGFAIRGRKQGIPLSLIQGCRQALLPDRSRGRRQGMLRADGCIEPIDEACEVAGKVRVKRVTGGEAGSD